MVGWNALTEKGRIGVRKSYRTLREGGVSRTMSQTLCHQMVFGVWIAGHGWNRNVQRVAGGVQ